MNQFGQSKKQLVIFKEALIKLKGSIILKLDVLSNLDDIPGYGPIGLVAPLEIYYYERLLYAINDIVGNINIPTLEDVITIRSLIVILVNETPYNKYKSYYKLIEICNRILKSKF